MDNSKIQKVNAILRIVGIFCILFFIIFVIYLTLKPKPISKTQIIPSQNVIFSHFVGRQADERLYPGVASGGLPPHFYTQIIQIKLTNNLSRLQKINPDDFVLSLNGSVLVPDSAQLLINKHGLFLFAGKTDTLILTYSSSSDIRKLTSLHIQSPLYSPYILPLN